MIVDVNGSLQTWGSNSALYHANNPSSLYFFFPHACWQLDDLREPCTKKTKQKKPHKNKQKKPTTTKQNKTKQKKQLSLSYFLPPQ